MWMTFGMYTLYVVRDAGLTPFQLLLAGAVLEFTVVAFEIPTGVLADTISRRFSVILGSFVTGLGWAVMGLFPSFEGILLGEFLWGFGFTFISGANEAWLADEIGEDEAAKIYPQAAQWRQAAVVAGVLVAAGFALVNLRLPFILGGAGGIAFGVFLAATMTEAGWHPADR
ncbi:MAG: MFS transporter, partial [Chloroflexi bacterium]|nr:MFS transporter [Chloroflexota bacterium]